MGGRCYQLLSEKQLDGAMKDFPPLKVKQCERQANSLFKPYLFVKDSKGSREVSCSACRRSKRYELPPRRMDDRLRQVLYGTHKSKAECPWCGAKATIIERRYIRSGVALEEYIPVVFLAARGGVLYAQGFWTRKDYLSCMDAAQLTAAPLFMETAAYRFRLGCAERYIRSNWDGRYQVERVKGDYSRENFIREPFQSGGTLFSRYDAYSVFNIAEITKSELKYSQYDKFRLGWPFPATWTGPHCDMMRYLTAYTQFPQQIEMLVKSGWHELVNDLVYERKKNRAIINWGEKDLRKAIGLSGQEIRAFRESGASVYAIGDYKTLRKVGVSASFGELCELEQRMTGAKEQVVAYCKTYRIRPARLLHYLDGQKDRAEHKNHSVYWTWRTWKDYVDTCAQLGYDLKNEAVLLPTELQQKHDEAAAELRRRREREARELEAQEKLQAKARLKKWRTKYRMEINGFVFRPAESSREIIAEGKALEHCVGGYAERHMAGKLTIVFLRRAETPEASLYTIEMHGTELVQIHGYKNEHYQGARNPRAVIGRELDTWLAWLRAGSKRDKQGNPILPKTKEKKEAKTA